MITEIEPGPGYCLAFGGTNAREAYLNGGDMLAYKREDTPRTPDDFFKWMAARVLKASETGAQWVVAGFPGPVAKRKDRYFIGPMANVPGLANDEYDLNAMLGIADLAYDRLLGDGFRLEPVNDGDLAGQAAANLIERDDKGKFNTIGDLILGTGLGAAIVKRDPELTEIFHPSGMPVEIGHIMEGDTPSQTYENHYSATALKSKHSVALEELPDYHPVWAEVAVGVGKCATILALFGGAEVVVPSGGVGAGAYDKYQLELKSFIRQCRDLGNATQRSFIPEIVRVPAEETDTYELTGAEGHMRHLLSLDE